MNKKRGMSIAAVLAIMICLISLVTTVFLVASRNSSLTSKSLRYIESYNNASAAIDSSIDLIVTEANKKLKANEAIDKNYVGDDGVLNKICQALFGSKTELLTEGEIDVKQGFVLLIQKDYIGLNGQELTLASSVEFKVDQSAGGEAIINSDLQFDNITLEKGSDKKTPKNELLRDKYNPSNMFWNYWGEQYSKKKQNNATNTLINSTNNVFYNFFNIWTNKDENNSMNGMLSTEKDYNYLPGGLNEDQGTSGIYKGDTLVKTEQQLKNEMGNFSFNIQGMVKAAIHDVDSSCSGKGQFENLVNQGNVRKDELGNLYVGSYISQWWSANERGNNVCIQAYKKNGNYVQLGNSPENTKAFELRGGKTLYICDQNVLVINGDFITDYNIIVERGSSLLVNGNLIVEEYQSSTGAYVAPIIDSDFVTPVSQIREGDPNSLENKHVGGGIMVLRNFDYRALNDKGVLLTDAKRSLSAIGRTNNTSYNYSMNLKDSYINGCLTVGEKVNILYDNADNAPKSNSLNRLPVGATIYNGAEFDSGEETSKYVDEDGKTKTKSSDVKLSNISFPADSKSARPFLLFSYGELSMKNVASQVYEEGKTIKYRSHTSTIFDELKSSGAKVGIGIITCKKLGSVDNQGTDLISKFNLFYNHFKEMENDGGKTIIDASVAMNNGNSSGNLVKTVHNGFVYSYDVYKCSSNIAVDSIHWFIPDKLRGEMISASISAIQTKK